MISFCLRKKEINLLSLGEEDKPFVSGRIEPTAVSSLGFQSDALLLIDDLNR